MNSVSAKIYLFLLSPIWAFLHTINNLGAKHSKWIIVWFFTIFGFTMNFPEGTDGSRHAENLLNHYDGLSLSRWFDEALMLLLLNPPPGTNDDIYLHTISYLAVIISPTTAVLYTIVGFIYGYFFASSVVLVFRKINWSKKSFFLILLFTSFLFWKSFEGLNSIRNWTGAWCMFYGVSHYIFYRKKIFWLFIGLAPLMHFGYFVIGIPVLIVVLFRNRQWLYSMIFIGSFFVSAPVQDFVSVAGVNELGESKLKLYQKDQDEFKEKQDKFVDESSFHKAYAIKFAKVTFKVLFIGMILLFGYYDQNNKEVPFVYFSSLALLFFSFSNSVPYVPSLSIRLELNGFFYALSAILFRYSFVINHVWYSNKVKVYNLLLFSSLPFIALYLFMQSSYILEFADLKIFLPIFLVILFMDIPLPIKEILKGILNL